ncbi:linearmycin resistance ATP-binding protein LnrL-like [Folsomia candida]|uniref:linearmycin resistance ATP-binding protein LnrL-like n=1 Tax=Folsomia candida TaxID=158441 RepID=UPI0016051D2E|nr:linearmycin resistance ATP-binding protein LnrL-like [Folsomia candida]
MAVQVRNGFKKYGRGEFVLNNLNVNIGRGEIFGLLGASGCGKTTLLSCIVGLRELDMGEITIFPRGNNLAQILGYMPQETALLNLLTIVESLRYFGIIYGMDESVIKKRVDFLTSFLDLRKTNNLVHTLRWGKFPKLLRKVYS